MKYNANQSDRDPGPALPKEITIRMAAPEDAPTIAALVRELAIFVKHEHYAKATPDDFRRHLFGPRPAAEAALAELGGKAVGFALWFSTFSTFRGQPGLYLEDVFVRPEYRSRGVGKALLAAVAALALERLRETRVVRTELEHRRGRLLPIARVLPLDEYTVYRIDDEPLRRLAVAKSERPRASCTEPEQ